MSTDASTLTREAPGGEAWVPRAGERPLIGVTTSEVRPSRLVSPERNADPARPEMALGMTYMRALERNGAVPVVIPPMNLDAVDQLLDQVGGVCLSGGPDIDPVAYRGVMHPDLGPTWLELDELELELARKADERGIPVFGICRGAQTMNVARGGDLHPHLPELDSVNINHRQSESGETVTHPVEIEPGTRLGEIVGQASIEVNSFHHQAVRRLGRDLRVSARSPDGTVEAIEDPSRPFFIGVQWHAEFLVHRAPETALFEAFVEAALWHLRSARAGEG